MEKKLISIIGKCCIFLIIANLPFLTLTYLFGIQTFIDSFNYPDAYQSIKIERTDDRNAHGGYILLERPIRQGYVINEQDLILYHSSDRSVEQKVISSVVSKNGVTMYYISDPDKDSLEEPIYKHQILGKIKAKFDDNIWNTLCMFIWDLTTDTVNSFEFF